MAATRRESEDRPAFAENGRTSEEEKAVFLDQSAPSSEPVKSQSAVAGWENSPPVSIVAYCLASISMTVVNKYVVSGDAWNLHFLYLAIQAIVCILTIAACKYAGFITSLAPLEMERAKKCRCQSF